MFSKAIAALPNDYQPVIVHLYHGKIDLKKIKESTPFGHIAIQCGKYYFSFGTGKTESTPALLMANPPTIGNELAVYGEKRVLINITHMVKTNPALIAELWSKNWKPTEYDINNHNCAHSIMDFLLRLKVLDEKKYGAQVKSRDFRPHALASLLCEVIIENNNNERADILKNEKINLRTKIELLIQNDINRLLFEITQQRASHKPIDLDIKQKKALELIHLLKRLPLLKLSEIQHELNIFKHNVGKGVFRNLTASRLNECIDLIKGIKPHQAEKTEEEYKKDQNQQRKKDDLIMLRLSQYADIDDQLNSLPKGSLDCEHIRIAINRAKQAAIEDALNNKANYNFSHDLEFSHTIINTYKKIQLAVDSYSKTPKMQSKEISATFKKLEEELSNILKLLAAEKPPNLTLKDVAQGGRYSESIIEIEKKFAQALQLAQRNNPEVKVKEADQKQNNAVNSPPLADALRLEWLTFQIQCICFWSDAGATSDKISAMNILLELYQQEDEYLTRSKRSIFKGCITDLIMPIWTNAIAGAGIDKINEPTTEHAFTRSIGYLLQKISAVTGNENPAKNLKLPFEFALDEANIRKPEELIRVIEAQIRNLPRTDNLGMHLNAFIQQLQYFIANKIYTPSQALKEIANEINRAKLSLTESLLRNELDKILGLIPQRQAVAMASPTATPKSITVSLSPNSPASPMKESSPVTAPAASSRAASPATAGANQAPKPLESPMGNIVPQPIAVGAAPHPEVPAARAAEPPKKHLLTPVASAAPNSINRSTMILKFIKGAIEREANAAQWATQAKFPVAINDKSKIKVPDSIRDIYSKLTNLDNDAKNETILKEIINDLKLKLKEHIKEIKLLTDSSEAIKLEHDWKPRLGHSKPKWLRPFYMGIIALNEITYINPDPSKNDVEFTWRLGLQFLKLNKNCLDEILSTQSAAPQSGKSSHK